LEAFSGINSKFGQLFSVEKAFKYKSKSYHTLMVNLVDFCVSNFCSFKMEAKLQSKFLEAEAKLQSKLQKLLTQKNY